MMGGACHHHPSPQVLRPPWRDHPTFITRKKEEEKNFISNAQRLYLRMMEKRVR